MRAERTVSVVLLSRNHERFVGAAIRSVLEQSWRDWDMVVVDNGSSDGSWELINERLQAEPAAMAVRTEKQLSIAGALNLGLGFARGRYIARIDSDDMWEPEKLRLQMEFMEASANQGAGVCGSNCLLIDAEGAVVAQKQFPQTHSECLRAFWYRNPVCHTAALIRRECFQRFGVYDEAFSLAEDLELWFRLGQGFELRNLPEHLTRVRIAGSNVTLRRQRQVIAMTLAARRRAIERYSYRPGPGAGTAMLLTWAAQWCPSRLVRAVFNRVFLPRFSFLWRNPPRRRNAPASQCQRPQPAPQAGPDDRSVTDGGQKSELLEISGQGAQIRPRSAKAEAFRRISDEECRMRKGTEYAKLAPEAHTAERAKQLQAANHKC
jgi:Glycosyl transferase family 2